MICGLVAQWLCARLSLRASLIDYNLVPEIRADAGSIPAWAAFLFITIKCGNKRRSTTRARRSRTHNSLFLTLNRTSTILAYSFRSLSNFSRKATSEDVSGEYKGLSRRPFLFMFELSSGWRPCIYLFGCSLDWLDTSSGGHGRRLAQREAERSWRRRFNP